LQVRVNFACYYRMPKDCNPETSTRLQKYIVQPVLAIGGTCWSSSILCKKPLRPYIYHTRMSWILGHLRTKTVIITDVLLVTRKHMAATPKGPYKEGKLQTNPRCCFYCPTMSDCPTISRSLQ